jgi:RNA polymerase sigma-70 factor (ECF subfamily)
MSASPRPPLRIVRRDESAPSGRGRTPEHPEDHDLADALAAGEAWAATATWNKHSPMVLRFLHRALGPTSDVEDLTQEVFAGVFSNVRALRNRDALRSFVFSVAVRTLKWELRRRKARRIFQLATFDQLPDHPVAAVDAESRQALRRFYAILDRLGAQERTAFVLRHMEGLKLEEVADALGMSLATVKRRLQRASSFVNRQVERDAALAPYARPQGSPP